MRPDPFEDPRELLELHLQEEDELRLRSAVVGCLVDIMDYAELERRTGEDWSIERDWLRHELLVLRAAERRAQAVNGTGLVLDPPTYDLEAGDEPAEVFDWDLDRLRWHGIRVPESACLVEAMRPAEYARRAMWEGF